MPPPRPARRIGRLLWLCRLPSPSAAAVDEHRAVEQRRVALADRLEPLEQVGELLDVEAVDLLELLVLFRVAAVVREVVVSLGNADEGVALGAPLVGVHEGADPGDVALEGEDHEVEHQADVLLVVLGDAVGTGDAVEVDLRPFLGTGDPDFQVADAGQVFLELALVAGTEPPDEARRRRR